MSQIDEQYSNMYMQYVYKPIYIYRLCDFARSAGTTVYRLMVYWKDTVYQGPLLLT